jgi:hypothetical protein
MRLDSHIRNKRIQKQVITNYKFPFKRLAQEIGILIFKFQICSVRKRELQRVKVNVLRSCQKFVGDNMEHRDLRHLP